MDGFPQIPPRDGEGNRAERGGGGPHLLHTLLISFASAALAACNQSAEPESNITADAVEQTLAHECKAPSLAMAGKTQSLESEQLKEAQANFGKAYAAACSKQLLADKPLVDPKASDQQHIFLVNAPEANVASIYLSEVDGNQMVLEYPFLTTDGKSQVPTADELQEAIYCAVRGATPEEQEASGRCLVD